MIRSFSARWITLTALTCIALGCAATQPPQIVADAGSRTYDGLYPVENARVDQLWARPDFDLGGYSKILLEGAGIQYRPTDQAGSERVFPLSAQQKERLQTVVGEAFVTELAKSEHFELTDQPGPDVLVVRGGLLDVVSRVPPERAGRSDVYLDSVGEATLVIELIDSENRTVLVRAVDRRAAEPARGMMRATSVTGWAEVQRLAATWARQLRVGLDQIHERLTLD
jgi:hypothetical protein